MRRYLAEFGPASAADVASFTGLPAPVLAPALEALPRVGGGLIDLPGAPRPDPETPAPVRFLPTWDATLLVHARRTGLLPEAHRPKIFSMKPALPVDLPRRRPGGRHVALAEGRIELEALERVDRAAMREVREEADRLLELHV